MQEAETRKAAREIEAVKLIIDQLHDAADGDDEFLHDLVEGETNLVEVMQSVAASIGEDEAHISGIKRVIETFNLRSGRLKNRIEVKRGILQTALDVSGLQKVETSIATISKKAVPAKAIIAEEAEIPSDFWLSGKPRLDTKAVLSALKDGQTIAGASLSNGGETVAIRWG